MELVKLALTLPHLDLRGLHCHVGSQVFGEDVYQRTLDIMVPFLAQIREETGVTLSDLNLGGGYGVRYTAEDEAINIPARLAELAAHLKEETERLGLPMPRFLMEPGRSIVADAGMTLYTVGSVKRIPGYKQYAAVDGGMTDNPATRSTSPATPSITPISPVRWSGSMWWAAAARAGTSSSPAWSCRETPAGGTFWRCAPPALQLLHGLQL